MIRSDKQRNALEAIHAVLITARYLAYQGQSAEVAELLDIAECLPMLMLEERDCTDDFRSQLVELAEQRSDCAHALQRFDRLVSGPS